jgi:hypothetical protein
MEFFLPENINLDFIAIINFLGNLLLETITRSNRINKITGTENK